MQIDEWQVGLWRMEGGFVTNDNWICGEWKVDLWRMTAGFVRSKGASSIGILPCKQHLLAYKPRLNPSPTPQPMLRTHQPINHHISFFC